MRVARMRRRFAVVGVLGLTVALLASVPSAMAASGRPDRPDRPTLDSVSFESAAISWADAGDSSVTGYKVLRRDRSVDARGVFHMIADNVSGTSYIDDTVEASGSYNYRVKARNANGLSRRSLQLRVEVPAEPAGAQAEPPGALSVTSATVLSAAENTVFAHQIEVEDTGAEGHVAYSFEILDYCEYLEETDSCNWDWDYFDVSTSGRITSFDLLDYEGNPPPRPYTLDVRITAASQGRRVSIDQPFEITVSDEVEGGAAQNFTATGQTQTTIALDWDPPANIDPNHYSLMVFKSGSEPAEDRLVAEFATVASRRTVDRLEANTSYDFYLAPKDDNGKTLDMVSLTHSTAS